jgi:S1-C subfamily serine protease
MSRASAAILIAGDRHSGTLCPLCQQEARLGDEVAVCQDCGTVHHRRCWDGSGHCGAYQCAPDRRAVELASSAIQISADEIAGAQPLPRRSPASFASDKWTVPPREEPRTSKLAVWSFVTAIIGLPAFGIVTGLLALILACTALSAMAGTRLKGAPWAVSAILIGLFDMVVWVGILAVYFGGGPQMARLDFQSDLPDLASLEGISPEISRAMRANVLIESATGRTAFSRRGIGSGVILSISKGEALIMTNRHVIDIANAGSKKPADIETINKNPIDVKLVGQPPEPARVVWVAPGGIDAALLRVRCSTDEAAATAWAPATPMHVGDAVFAIGNPHNLGWTHTQGTISQFRMQGEGDARIRVIQTQTAINPGNSGGGLYDAKGNLLGINTWTSDRRISEGISFAISFESLLALHPADLEIPKPATAEAEVEAQSP